MPTVKKLLINRFVTGAAVAWRYAGVDHETVMVCSLLALRHLMAVETIDALLRVSAHLKLVNDRVL